VQLQCQNRDKTGLLHQLQCLTLREPQDLTALLTVPQEDMAWLGGSPSRFGRQVQPPSVPACESTAKAQPDVLLTTSATKQGPELAGKETAS